MVDTTWTNGGGDGKASTAANWSNGIDVGYNVIFDGTSTANCTFDYALQLGNFTIAAGYTGTITQSSDMYITGYSQAGGKLTGNVGRYIYISGDFTKTAGLISDYYINLWFTGNGTISTDSTLALRSLFIDPEVSIQMDSGQIIACRNFKNQGILTITLTDFRIYPFDDGGGFNNTGIINAANSVYFGGGGTALYDRSIYLGIINGQLEWTSFSSLAASRKVTLMDNASLDSLSIISGHATYTCTLNLNGHSLTANSITIGTRGILSNSAATDSVISCASFDSSAGTFTEANTQVILNGNGTLKTAAGHKFDELVQRDNVITTLASDITVTNEFDTAGSFGQGAYSITHENPEKRLIAPMVNPIIRNPKRSPFLNNRFTKNIEIEVV